MPTQSLSWTQQRGAATLIVAIVLLLALTLATFSAARIGVSEQRSVANEIRAKQAFWVAQGGVEQGIAFLNANKALITSASVQAAATPVSPPVEQGWLAEPPRPPAMRWTVCQGRDGRNPPCRYDDANINHGNRWMFYNNPNRLAVNNFFQQLAINGNPPDYLFDLDFLAWSDILREGFGSYPRINSRIIVTATVTTPVGADPLRALPGAASQDALRVSQIVSGYDTLVGRPGATLPPVGGVPIVTSFPPYIDAPLMVAGTAVLNAGVSIWGNPVLPIPPAPTPPIYHNPVFDGALNPDVLGAIPAIARTLPGIPVAIPANSRSLSIWSRDSTRLGAGTGAETCVPLTPLRDTLTPGYPNPGNFRNPRLSGSGANANCGGGAGAVAGIFALPPVDDIVQCVPYPPTVSNDPLCTPIAAGFAANASAPPFFPPDLFYYVFGVGNDAFQRVRSDATELVGCGDLASRSSGFYWVDGNCSIPANTNIGGDANNPTAPITLVVNGGNFTLGAGVNFWGTVYLRNSALALPNAGLRPVLHGALIVDQNLTINAGQLDLVYDPRVFMTSSARGGGFAKVLGGWADRAQ